MLSAKYPCTVQVFVVAEVLSPILTALHLFVSHPRLDLTVHITISIIKQLASLLF
jgi:hypothetical protein